MSEYNLLREITGSPTTILGLNFRKVVSPIDGALNQYMIVSCFTIMENHYTGKYEISVQRGTAYDGEFNYPSHNEEGEPIDDTIYYGAIEPIAKCREYWRFCLKNGYKHHNSLNIDLSLLTTHYTQLERVKHSLQTTP